jgi:hypothetical protein
MIVIENELRDSERSGSVDDGSFLWLDVPAMLAI